MPTNAVWLHQLRKLFVGWWARNWTCSQCMIPRQTILRLDPHSNHACKCWHPARKTRIRKMKKVQQITFQVKKSIRKHSGNHSAIINSHYLIRNFTISNKQSQQTINPDLRNKHALNSTFYFSTKYRNMRCLFHNSKHIQFKEKKKFKTWAYNHNPIITRCFKVNYY